MESEINKTQNIEAEPHYNDGLIDAHFITFNGDPFAVVVNCSGDAKVMDCTDNFYSDADLLLAYRQLWREDWGMDDEKDAYIEKFKGWLIEGGSDPEMLED